MKFTKYSPFLVTLVIGTLPGISSSQQDAFQFLRLPPSLSDEKLLMKQTPKARMLRTSAESDGVRIYVVAPEKSKFF
jgi:hypothetical protein